MKTLYVQGNFLALAAAEKEDVVWKSYMYSLKQGTLKFLLNTTLDTLPIAANLVRWKKSSCDLCKLCRRRETTNHVLNGCPVGLDQGRYTYRHNSVMNYIVKSEDSKLKVYSVLPGHIAPVGGSIPSEIFVTAEKTDIVILNNHKKEIHMFELTCPSEHNIEKRHLEKRNKYAHFINTELQGKRCDSRKRHVNMQGL